MEENLLNNSQDKLFQNVINPITSISVSGSSSESKIESQKTSELEENNYIEDSQNKMTKLKIESIASSNRIECTIGDNIKFYPIIDRLNQLYKYIENFDKIVETTKEGETNFIKRMLNKNNILFDDEYEGQIISYFLLPENRTNFLTNLNNYVNEEQKKYKGEIWPPQPFQKDNYTNSIFPTILKKFPEGFQKLFNLQVVEIIDRETTQPEIVAENKDLFKETINKSNLVDKINIYLFLRKFPEIDMNVHSNLVVYLAEQNTVVSYDSSGISRRKIGQNGVKLDNNIDTGLFMNWLNLSDKNKLFLNESFIQKDLHSCGSFATSILIFKLNFLYNKYTKLIEAEEIKNTNEVIQKLSGALFKEEEKFHSQVFQESKNIKTEGDIQSQQLMETKLDPALISLGQLKNVVELAKKLDKSLKDCEKFLNVASFFENRIIGDATLESFNVEVDERQVAILQDNKVNFVKSSSRSIQNTIKSIINNKCEIKSIAFKNEGKYYE